MADLGQRMGEVRRVVQVEWTPARARAAEQGFARRRKARVRRRKAGLALAGVVMAALVVLFGLRTGRGQETALVAKARLEAAAAEWGASSRGSPRAPLALRDGSIVRPHAGALVLRQLESASRVEVEVAKGGASFDVTPNKERLFRVAAGDVAVEVLGTAFSVDRIDGKVRVEVERGRVRVRWGDASRELGVGEHGTFPPSDADEAASMPRSPADEARSHAAADPRPSAPALEPEEGRANSKAPDPPVPSQPLTWNALAKAGDYENAYEALHDAKGTPPRDVPEELLLAADVARLSGHPAEAIEPLRRIARDHRGDPRAALAAFTLGRVLLDSLGRPREAADAFADARALGGGGLGEEALAREVEARSRAGDAERARALAEQYLVRFPEGKRSRTVKKFGGLE